MKDRIVAEGDTLVRARLRLEPVLSGQVITEFWCKGLLKYKPRPGFNIENVRTVGKHLLLDFERNLTLRTHLGMNGYWKVVEGQTLPSNSKIRFDPYLKMIIATELGYALCFKAHRIDSHIRTADESNVVDVRDGTKTKTDSVVTNLGPDLCAEGFDIEQVLSNVRAQPQETLIIECLLNQQVACGIGNIFKSEALFFEKLNPFLMLSQLSEQQINALYKRAADLMQQNSRSGMQRRQTANDGRFYVYKRYRLACKLCDGHINRSYRGQYSRSTYWCETCQT